MACLNPTGSKRARHGISFHCLVCSMVLMVLDGGHQDQDLFVSLHGFRQLVCCKATVITAEPAAGLGDDVGNKNH